jgi:hypothetical protein
VAAVIDLKFRGEPNVEANLSIMIGTAALIEEVVVRRANSTSGIWRVTN